MLAAALRRTSRSTRVVFVVVATALAGWLFAAVAFTQGAKTASKVIKVSGALRDHTQVKGCPVAYCNEGKYTTGGLRGTPFQYRLGQFIPTDVPGVNLYTGRQTIRTSRGKIECSSNGVINANPKSKGEGVHLCSIDGGTGFYAGATGYFQERFFFSNGNGFGDYRGVIRVR